MPSSPLILLSPFLLSCCLSQLIVVLSFVLCNLSFLSQHNLPSDGAFTVYHATTSCCATVHLLCSCSFSTLAVCHVAFCHTSSSQCTLLLPLVWLVVTLAPSHATYLAGCHVTSHNADASSCPPVPLPLVIPLPLILPLLFLSSFSGWLSCHLSSCLSLWLPASLPPMNFVQACAWLWRQIA